MNTTVDNKSPKVLGIELLKFIAAVMITNSHFKGLYVAPFTALGTFGAPGNALFFFVSGYTLALSSRKDNFLNFYKRRIGRIYPSMLAWSTLVGPLLIGLSITWQSVWLGGNYWFVHCILAYYILIYFILRYLMNVFNLIVALSVVASCLFFIWMPVTSLSIYQVSFHYVCFFTLTLMGVYCAKNRGSIVSKRKYLELIYCLFSLCVFYGIQFVGKDQIGWKYYFQLISLLPLYSFIYYLYLLLTAAWVQRLFEIRFVGILIRFIAALTLEIYLVGFAFGFTNFNHLFPLNLLIVFGIIVAAAYFVKVISNVIVQVFSNKDSSLKDIFVII